MNESIWVLFPEFLGHSFDRSVIGIKVFLCKSLASRSSRFSGFLGNLVGSGIVSRVATILAQCMAFVCKERCFSQALKSLRVNVRKG
jgi:hypothetical protein